MINFIYWFIRASVFFKSKKTHFSSFMKKFCFDLSELSEACLIRPLRQKFEKVSSLLISL